MRKGIRTKRLLFRGVEKIDIWWWCAGFAGLFLAEGFLDINGLLHAAQSLHNQRVRTGAHVDNSVFKECG